MAVFTREPLSGSTSGTPIPVTSSDAAGAVTVHTCDTNKYELYLFAYNISTASVELSVEKGTTSAIVQAIAPRSGMVPVLPGAFLTGNKVVKAYASTVSTGGLFVDGWVNKIV